MAVLLGNGDGTFRPLARIPLRATAMAVLAADLDGDGIPDLAVGLLLLVLPLLFLLTDRAWLMLVVGAIWGLLASGTVIVIVPRWQYRSGEVPAPQPPRSDDAGQRPPLSPGEDGQRRASAAAATVMPCSMTRPPRDA